jgi:hypothetical protein
VRFSWAKSHFDGHEQGASPVMHKYNRILVMAATGWMLAAGGARGQDNPGIVVQAPVPQIPGVSNQTGQLPPGAFPFLPPKIIHYGWPALRIYRRDLPMPEPQPDPTRRETKFVHPRSAKLVIFTRQPARIYIDGEELECIDEMYQMAPPKPLLPGVPYMHTIRVEGFDDEGRQIARTIVVYLRMGRVTELTFF